MTDKDEKRNQLNNEGISSGLSGSSGLTSQTSISESHESQIFPGLSAGRLHNEVTIVSPYTSQISSMTRKSSGAKKFKVTPSKLFTSIQCKYVYINKQYESLDYDMVENELYIEQEYLSGYQYFRQKELIKWVMFLQIGLFTATIASVVDMFIAYMTEVKYRTLADNMERYQSHNQYIVMLLWVFLNVVPFCIGSLLVTYMEPNAAGSGIPLVKCYLNGIEIPRMLDLKTLFVKALGLACSIIGGVASGKEGPMIHIGACTASLLSKGYIRICEKNHHLYRYFREDQEKRDLVSAGAASGVSAAFGASVGGVLFSLEEGSSFWNQSLTWKMFFSSVISKFTVNFILSAYYGSFGDLTHPSLVNLGQANYKYKIYEIPIFMAFGVLGGLLGALWNLMNYKMNLLRLSYLRRKWLRIIESAVISGATAVLAFVMSFSIQECGDASARKDKNFLTTALCEDKDGVPQYNTIASMWLQTPQATVNGLLHDPTATYTVLALSYFTVAYYFLSCITFGMSSSNGIFVPALLTGAAWGRLLCMLLRTFISADFLEPGKYALIAAAAQLGGIVRMTISLTVIIMETSNNISFSLPIILTLICAKMTGDFFNEGIYAINIKLKGAPFLPWDPPLLTRGMPATDFMSKPCTCLRTVEPVKFVVNLLQSCVHNGFPVVDCTITNEWEPREGKVKGLILREQLLVLLVNRMFVENKESWAHIFNMNTFHDAKIEKPHFDSFAVSDYESMYFHIDVSPFMNSSPYTLLQTASFPRIFRLFRALGLRHLPIVNDSNVAIGMITRKDLAKYKMSRLQGQLELTILEVR